MCHCRGLNSRINQLHECALKTKSQILKLCLKMIQLLQSTWKTYIISSLKVKNDISPDVIRDIFHFQENENYNLRSGTHLASRNMRTNCLGKKWYQTQEPKYVRCCQRNLKMLHLCKLLKVN